MKILANNITPNGQHILTNSGFEIITEDIPNNELISFINEHQIDGIILNSPDEFNIDFVDMCSSLKLIAFKQLTESNQDIQYAKEQGLHIIDAENATAVSIAEMAFAHLLGMVRFLHQSNREMPLEGETNFYALHHNFKGVELRGKTIGIVGMNASGVEMAKIALGFGMKILMTDHEPKNVLIPIDFFDGQSVEFYIEPTNFNELISTSDFLIINTSGNGAYIIDTPQIEKLKSGVGVVNMIQGAVNEMALLNAIEDKKVNFAGLDVFEKQPNPEIQLLMNPELSLSPNTGAKTYEAEAKISEILSNQIINLLAF